MKTVKVLIFAAIVLLFGLTGFAESTSNRQARVIVFNTANWGPWSKWSSCNQQCDDGKKTRTRRCNSHPVYGNPCPGNAKQTADCIVKRCFPGPEDTSFEDPHLPFGMWKNRPGAQLQWIRHQGPTKTIDTGPFYDHTYGDATGHYLYMESSGPGTAGKEARLISPTLTSKPFTKCLKFYYHMYGQTTGHLIVVIHPTQGKPRHVPFSKKGNQGNQWKLATIDLDEDQHFKIEIIATVGQRGYSDIAIDDVYIDDGKCSCQDNYPSCFVWSKMGECKKNPVFMTSHCKRSCNICKDSKCEDLHAQCPYWAMRGECTKPSAIPYMTKNCPLSCRLCETPKCKDYHKNCHTWAFSGECSRQTYRMYKLCPKSCNICTVHHCQDLNTQIQGSCQNLASSGDCKKSSRIITMHSYCQKSCGACVLVPQCRDNYPQRCRKAAAQGKCNAEASMVWMYSNCEQTCGNCN